MLPLITCYSLAVSVSFAVWEGDFEDSVQSLFGLFVPVKSKCVC